jgi:hypothetical protein
VAAQGDRLTLPGEHDLRLVSAQRGRNGLPTAPSEPDAAGVTDGRALALSPDVPTDELVPGATLLLQGTGKPRELTVASRRTVNAKTAAGIATASADRLVLLQVRQDGSVLVVVAE